MTIHLVLMRLHDAETAPFITDRVLSMRDSIPGLLSIHGGESIVQLPTTWDLGFVMRFDSPETVQTYQAHEVHEAVAADIRPHISQMATCDLPDES